MSKCSIVRDLLPIYDDGAVSPETDTAVRAHLGVCAECREYHRRINQVTRAMQDQQSHNSYRYSGVVRRIRQRNMAELAVGAFVITTAVIGFIKAIRQ